MGNSRASSPGVAAAQVPKFRVDLRGATEVTLRVLNGGDGYNVTMLPGDWPGSSKPALRIRWNDSGKEALIFELLTVPKRDRGSSGIRDSLFRSAGMGTQIQHQQKAEHDLA